MVSFNLVHYHLVTLCRFWSRRRIQRRMASSVEWLHSLLMFLETSELVKCAFLDCALCAITEQLKTRSNCNFKFVIFKHRDGSIVEDALYATHTIVIYLHT